MPGVASKDSAGFVISRQIDLRMGHGDVLQKASYPGPQTLSSEELQVVLGLCGGFYVVGGRSLLHWSDSKETLHVGVSENGLT